MRKSLSTIFAAVALLAAPAMAAEQQPSGTVITDLDCILTVDQQSDFYEGCNVVGLSEDGLVGLGFALDPQRSIIFVGPATSANTMKVMGVGINGADPVSVAGTCTVRPQVITCQANVAGRIVKVEARGQTT